MSTGVLEQIVHDNIEAILQCLLGVSDSLDAPRAAGRIKAEYEIPMAGLLHAYRLAGLHLWDALVAKATTPERTAALLVASSRVWGIIDRYSNAAVETYREVVDERARKSQQSRNVTLLALLEGEFTGDIGRATRLLDLPHQGVYAVIAVEMSDSGEDPVPAISERLRSRGMHSAWAQWKGEYVGLVACPTGLDVSAVPFVVAESASSRVGVSRPFIAFDYAPTTVTQALIAMKCVAPDASGVHSYGAAPIDTMLVAQSGPATELRDEIFGELAELDPTDARVLLDTLTAWFDADGSTAECGRQLHCHRYTCASGKTSAPCWHGPHRDGFAAGLGPSDAQLRHATEAAECGLPHSDPLRPACQTRRDANCA